MTTIALLGAGCGMGIWLIYRVIASRADLTDVGTTLALPGRPARAPIESQRSLLERRVAHRLVELLKVTGMDPARRRADLRVTRRTVDQHVLAKLTAAVVLGGTSTAGAIMLGVPGGYVVMLGFLATICGFMLPEMTLSSQAKEARKAFRHAYGAYLDLVNVMLAAGAGPESALHTSADSGGGWAFAEIRNALASARSSHRSIPDAFALLGEELDVSELGELAASVALVGSQGARVRASLVAKADSLRSQQISETEAEAESATERMTVPVVVLLFGFLLFLAYPAVINISQVGGGG